jgi:hypothetical protein
MVKLFILIIKKNKKTFLFFKQKWRQWTTRCAPGRVARTAVTNAVWTVTWSAALTGAPISTSAFSKWRLASK